MTDAPAKSKKGALLTVFLVVLIDLMGFGIVLPLLPFYASHFGASPFMIGALYSVYSLCQLFFSPIWGGLSDRIGRRPVMLLSTLGTSAAYILLAFSNSFVLLFLARMMAGVMGGNISTAQAYVADVTTPENRARGMGLIGAAFGIGFAVGPAISGLCLPLGQAVPGFVAAGMSFASFLLAMFHLPETVRVAEPQQNEDPTRVQKLSVFSAGFWGFLRQQKGLLTTLLFCYFLISVGHSSLYGAFPLYCSTVVQMTAREVAMQFVWMGSVAILVQGGLIRPLVKALGEKNLFFVGNILMTLGLFLIPWATSGPMLTFFVCVMAVGGSLNGPTLTSLISKEADPSRAGLMMGTSQGLSSLGRVLGPVWGGLLFQGGARLPFLATSLLLCWTVLIGLGMVRKKS